MTNLQLHFQKAKRLGVNLTVLATSISLAACGGGGGGYYGNVGDSGSNPDNSVNPGDSVSKEVAGIALSLDKTELNVKGDTLTLIAKAVDKDGGGVANAEVKLNIKDGLKNGATADVSQVATDEKGNATFTVTLSGSNPDLTELLFTATVVGTTINDVKKVAVTGAGTVTQSQYELNFDSAVPLRVSGGETSIRIRAVDVNGGGVPNENVALKVQNFQKNGVTIKGLSSAVTDNQGYAEFILVLPAGTEVSRADLIKQGVSLEATLTEASGATKTQVYTVGVNSVANVVTKLTLATDNNNKIDAVDGTIQVTVSAKNPEGLAVTNKEVQLNLDEQAVKYGAKLTNAVVKTNSKGEAVFTIKTVVNQDNPDGKALVNNGITVQALLKEDASVVTQRTKITVVSPVAEEVTSLSIATANEINVAGDEAVVTVTAKDKNGGALANKAINLTIPQTAGLSIKTGSKVVTDSNGQAKFTLSFNPSNVPAATLNALLTNGIIVTAQYNGLNSQVVTQTTRVGFYQINVEKEVQRIILTASKGIVSSTGDTVQVVAQALDNDGNPAVNKLIKFEFTNKEVEQNGVSFAGAESKNTDENGKVSFTLHVNALNEQAIQKLIASGIAVKVGTVRADGSDVTQNTTIMVAASALSTAEVSYLKMNSSAASLDVAKANQEISINVQAYKSNGAIVANKDIALSLDKNYSGIQIDQVSPTTNAEGLATFALKYSPNQLSEAERAELIKNGLGISAKFGTVIQKTRVSFYRVGVNIQRMDLVVDKPALIAEVGVAQTVKATVTLKDSAGAAVKGRQVTVELDNSKVLQNGVSIVGATGGSAVVNTNDKGQATVSLNVKAADQAALDALLASGIDLKALAVQGDGSGTISQNTSISVLSKAAENEVGYLTAESNTAIATTGGSSTLTIRAFTGKGIAAANKSIKLALSNVPAGLNIKVDAAGKTTNSAGEATFNVTYTAAKGLTAEQIKALLSGVTATASYTNGAGKVITQNTTLQFYVNEQNIQRMDLVVDKPALIAEVGVEQKVKATVTLKDSAGAAVKGRQVAIALDSKALQNGVSIAGARGGSTVITTNDKGQASVSFNVNAANQAALDALLASGIGVGASAVQSDGSDFISQNTKVNVVTAEATYLTMSSDKSIATTGGEATITVKAQSAQGIAASNQKVRLALNLAQLPGNINLKINGTDRPQEGVETTTNSNGIATFKVLYTAQSNLTAEQINLLLGGIQATASYTAVSTNIKVTQSTTLQFYADQQSIQRMDLAIEKPLLLVDTDTDTAFISTVTLKDQDGNPIKNRQVLVEIDNYGVDNNILLTAVNFPGVTGGSVVVTTDVNGQAKVSVNVKTPTQDIIDKLVSKGISLKFSAVQGDGSGTISRNTSISVLSKAAESEVGYLTVDSSDVIKTTGGSSTIAVRAFTAKGIAASGKNIALRLGATPAGLNIKLDQTSATTGVDGKATFKLTYAANTRLSTEQIKALLAGIQVDASYTSSSGQKIAQNTNVQFAIDQINIQSMDVKVSEPVLTLKATDSRTVTATIKLKDASGKPINERQVTLAISQEALQNGVSIKGAPNSASIAVDTDTNGIAKVTLNVAIADQAQLDRLIAAGGIGIGVSAVQGDGSGAITQNTRVNILSQAAEDAAASEVGYLTVENSRVLDITGGSTDIVVKAFNPEGKLVKGKQIKLDILSSIPTGLQKYFSTGTGANKTAINGAINATLDAMGKATITLNYEASNLTAEQVQTLLAGLPIKASYTSEAGKVTSQSSVVQFVSSQPNIQRMDLVTAMSQSPTQNGGAFLLKLNSKESFRTTVTLKDRNGQLIKDRQVILTLDNIAVDNNILFRVVNFGGVTGGSTVVTTDENGQAEVTVEALVQSQADLDALIASGIDVSASAVQGDGSSVINQTTHVTVTSKAVEEATENAVSYLKATSSQSLATTVNGTTQITVEAYNAKGNALEGKGISLALADIPAGLTISAAPSSATSDTTDVTGKATFTVTYTAPADGNLTAAQIKGLIAGIQATANYTDGGKVITQSTKIHFYANSGAIANDAQRLELTTSKNEVTANSDNIVFTTKVFGRDGNPVKDRFVSLSLDAAATQNGITIAGARQQKTDANGEVSFTINVRASNQQMIDNLVANGINLSATVVQSNGAEFSQTTHVMAKAPQTLAVKELKVTPSAASIESTGGSSVVAVRAIDAAGNPVVNQNISFALGGVNATNARVSVDKTSAATNSQGYAYFTVNIANGEVDNDLVKDGLTYAVNTINQNDGNAVSQVGKINVSVPAGTYNLLPLHASKPNLMISGDTVTVTSKLVDNKGAPLKSQPVSLVVDKVTLNGGVNVDGGMTGITDTNGNVSFKITLPAKTLQAQIDELLSNGLTIKTSVKLPNGNTRFSPDLKLNVEAAVNPYHLVITSSSDNLSVNGDKAIITVSALANGTNVPAANQQVTLKVKKTNSTTGLNVGIVNEAEGNDGIADTYTVTTDQNGNGFFTLLVPEGGLDKDALFASGIELEASHTATNGTTTKQVYRLGVDRPGSTAPRHTLRISASKPQLNVRDDTADVTVTLLDQNGGVLQGQYITLAVSDFIRNGASIVGASGKTTDSSGQAIFTVRVDATMRNQNYSAADFVNDGLILRATFAGTSTQDFRIDIIQAVTAQPVGNLTFGKSALLETSADGNYYTEAVSAQLVDNDGKPIINQPVTMSIDLLSVAKGIYTPTKDVNGDPTRAKTTSVTCMGATLPATAQVATAFVSSQGSTNNIVTYTTDNSGKFDFRIRYLRQYAGWQIVNLNARVAMGSAPVQNLEARLNYPLTMVKSDFESEAGQPFDRSPYGVSASCANLD
ncbi:beta strand repeat-containing protein [Alkanindiges sp. WGS2144]|uniref:beta strand repeat-containing protein n=1 Tax=Alkanindiges sp. WGS2144 TaxID=3366808 RepID=UPI0037512DB9